MKKKIFFEKGKFKEIYEKFAYIKNNLLEKINSTLSNYEQFESKEIDLLNLDFENYKTDFREMIITNTFRDLYILISKIKYNKYNSFTIDFDAIEKLLEDNFFIKNACYLKIDKIIEIECIGDEILNNGIFNFNKKILNQKI